MQLLLHVKTKFVQDSLLVHVHHFVCRQSFLFITNCSRSGSWAVRFHDTGCCHSEQCHIQCTHRVRLTISKSPHGLRVWPERPSSKLLDTVLYLCNFVDCLTAPHGVVSCCLPLSVCLAVVTYGQHHMDHFAFGSNATFAACQDEVHLTAL